MHLRIANFDKSNKTLKRKDYDCGNTYNCPVNTLVDAKLSHPEWEAEGSMIGLESHWSPLLQDGLVGCMQALTNGWRRVVIVLVTGGRVVIVVVVYRLVGVIVLLLSQEVRVEVSVEVKMGFNICIHAKEKKSGI